MSYIGPPPVSNIPAGSVGTEEIQDASVGEADIANNAVTFAKIASGDIADQATAEAGLSAVKLMTPQRTLQSIENYYKDTILDSYSSSGGFVAGTTQALTLTNTPGSVNNIFVFFDGVYQPKNTFTIDSNGDLAFNEVIPVDVENVDVMYAILSATGVPSDGSITIAKLASGLLANLSELESGTSGKLVDAPTFKSYADTYIHWTYLAEDTLTSVADFDLFLTLPDTVTEIQIFYDSISSSSTGTFALTLGVAAGLITTGYTSTTWGGITGNSTSGTTSTTNFNIYPSVGFTATNELTGITRLYRKNDTDDIWFIDGNIIKDGTAGGYTASGQVDLGDTLTRMQLNVLAGNFDNGTVQVRYR